LAAIGPEKRRSVDRSRGPVSGSHRAAARTRLLQTATWRWASGRVRSSVPSPSCRDQGGVRARQWRERVVGGASGSGPDSRIVVKRAVLGTPPCNVAALMRFSRLTWPRPIRDRGRVPAPWISTGAIRACPRAIGEKVGDCSRHPPGRGPAALCFGAGRRMTATSRHLCAARLAPYTSVLAFGRRGIVCIFRGRALG
jgi:hypothetical protein